MLEQFFIQISTNCEPANAAPDEGEAKAEDEKKFNLKIGNKINTNWSRKA